MKTMNCKNAKSLMSEFVDERLSASDAWQVQTHLLDCAVCEKLHRDLAALRRTLQALPTRQPSANFDAALAQRLALTRRPAPHLTWRDRLSRLFPRPMPLLRPAFALSVALAAVGGVLLLPTHPPIGDATTAAAVHIADHAFVADCVAQHRRDAAGDPLADLAAQNLADHLDNGSLSQQPPAPNASSEVF